MKTGKVAEFCESGDKAPDSEEKRVVESGCLQGKAGAIDFEAVQISECTKRE